MKTMTLHTRFQLAAAVVATLAFQAVGSAQETPKAAPRSEADAIAEAFLKAGSELFDAKDASGLAATYTEDGQVIVVSQKDGEVQDIVKEGRADIEEFYDQYFRGVDSIDSENIVELTRRIAPDILVVHGRFRPNPGQAEWPFVQMRVKRGDRWLLSKLWLFVIPGA